jgi:hypothetical protein
VQQKAFRWGIWHPSVMQFYSGPLIHFLSGVDISFDMSGQTVFLEIEFRTRDEARLFERDFD